MSQPPEPVTASPLDLHTNHKKALAPLRAAMVDFEAEQVRRALSGLLAADAVIHMAHPFGDLIGPEALYQSCYEPLFNAMPDLERRDWIVMAGPDQDGEAWVGCGGHYVGTFVAPWLDIPPTGHITHMRFHEYFKFSNGKVTEIQALWDIPEVMLQANAWPLAPSLGREFFIPGPSTLDGVIPGPWHAADAEESKNLVIDMLTHLTKHPGQGGPELMEMERFWHPHMTWYGPAGIGTARGISGFRNWHQIPFLNALPNRGQSSDGLDHHFFGDANYVAVTGWPDMRQTHSDAGWLGLPPTGKTFTARSLDFWRIENGKIRENWVMVDLLDVYDQLGVDVFARLREFNKARVPGRMPFPLNTES